MPLDPLSVTITLDSLICHSKGNDPGPRAEPYLWAVFFKVDGTTATLSDPDLTLSGAGFTAPTPGDHGDLGVREVAAGQILPIPAAIGRFQTTLTAIPVSEAIQTLGVADHVAGAVGVLCVLMEQDWTSSACCSRSPAAPTKTRWRQSSPRPSRPRCAGRAASSRMS